MGNRALIVIDIQNDYFSGGGYVLHDAEAVEERVVSAIAAARQADIPVVLIHHVLPAGTPAPILVEGTDGVALRPRIVEAAGPNAPVVRKVHADSFEGTELQAVLQELGAEELLIAGMMTQHCVTHTALSPAAASYEVTVLPDLCTTVDPLLHGIAVQALELRVALAPSQEALA